MKKIYWVLIAIVLVVPLFAFATDFYTVVTVDPDNRNIADILAEVTGIAYEGTTQRTGAFPIFKSATVSSGSAVFHLTDDGLSTGSTLCPNGVVQDSVNAFVSDASASYQMAYAFSNADKTVTVTTNKLTTANILTGVLGQTAGNGSVVKLSVWCY